MINIREATGRDVAAIRDIFLATYETDYTDTRLYDEGLLTRLVYSEESLLLVAEDNTGRVVGTASVDLEVGAHSDLVGEFCRLAVHPDCRNRGVAKALMAERVKRVQDRIQVGLVEARVSHPYSLRVAEMHHFAVVGYLPDRWRLRTRESLALLVCFFGNALELRNNHPRIIPEVHALAHMALENCALPSDAIVDEDAPPYPPGGSFDLHELTTEGYAALLRIERGRVRQREIFGPARLHYGIFKLQNRRSRYLIAREDGRIVGAVGFTLDPVDKAVRIFELIALHDGVIRFLLSELERSCREKWDCLIEVDISAHAPRMQRTLLELGFLPVAYLPALVFHDVERLDVVKMLRLTTPPQAQIARLTPSCEAFADLVLRLFRSRMVLPKIADAVHHLSLFAGLTDEQIVRLAGTCAIAEYKPGDKIFTEGQPAQQMHVLLEGEAAVSMHNSPIPGGVVRRGECLGEVSFLTGADHSASARAVTLVETAVLERSDLLQLIRLRPDIGLHLYKNLAVGTGEKLRRLDASLAHVDA